jgi:hypothetical protein
MVDPSQNNSLVASKKSKWMCKTVKHKYRAGWSDDGGMEKN